MNFRFCLVLAALTQVVGCASIVSGQNQSVFATSLKSTF